MKKMFFLGASLLALLSTVNAQTTGFTEAKDVKVVVEEVDNGDVVPGKTFRVYLILPSADDQLQAVYGEPGASLELRSSKTFYQSEYGGATAAETNHQTLEISKELAFDSWLTIGAPTSKQNATQTFKFNPTGFEEKGYDLEIGEGAIFIEPGYEQSLPDENGRVLVAQLTSEGEVSGTLNIQVRSGGNDIDQDGQGMWSTWKKNGITFVCK